jgi:hypothetical protein
MTHPANEYRRTMPAAGMGFKRRLPQRAIDIVELVACDHLIVGRSGVAGLRHPRPGRWKPEDSRNLPHSTAGQIRSRFRDWRILA